MKSEFFCCFCDLLLFCWEQLQCHLQSVISMEQKMGAVHHPLNFHPLLQGAHLEPKIQLWVLSSLTVLFWEMARCCWETWPLLSCSHDFAESQLRASPVPSHARRHWAPLHEASRRWDLRLKGAGTFPWLHTWVYSAAACLFAAWD